MGRLPSQKSIDKLFWVLCVNAALLGLILLVLVCRDGRSMESVAFGQNAPVYPPVVGSSAGMGTSPAAALENAGPAVVMPGQLSPNVWGCYLLDNQRQTLCVYEYLHNEGLRLVAARDVRFDRVLKNFNTAPAPSEIEAMGKEPAGAGRVLKSSSGVEGQ